MNIYLIDGCIVKARTPKDAFKRYGTYWYGWELNTYVKIGGDIRIPRYVMHVKDKDIRIICYWLKDNIFTVNHDLLKDD
tara:strand:- start:2659 stop:2895 length:237 start_codon:yes stop_codon:yes gene_type:complete